MGKRQSMNKRKAGFIAAGIVWLLLFLTGILFSVNIFGITSHITGKIYPEAVITSQEFTPPKAYLKEFTQNEDGSITSDSADPWIFVNLINNGLTNLHTLELNVISATNLGEDVYVYYADSYQSVNFVMGEGCNRVALKKAAENDNGLRIDLASRQKQTLQIDNIIINNNSYLTKYYSRKAFSITICFLWFSLLLLLPVLTVKRKILPKDMADTPDRHGIFRSISYGGSYIIGFVIALFFSWHTNTNTNKLFWEYDLGNLMIWLTVCFLGYLAVKGHLSTLLFAVTYIALHGYFQYSFNDESFGWYLSHMYFNSMLAVNVLVFCLLVLTLQRLLGMPLGNLIFAVVFGLYLLGNLIKMKYQNALFSSADFALAGEIVGIAGQYVNFWILLTVLMLFVGIVVLCVKFRKKLREYLKPHFHWSAIPTVLCFFVLTILILCNVFENIGINTKKEYLTNKEQLNAMGFGLYTLLEFSGNQNTGEPEGYNEGIRTEMEQYKNHSGENQERPTVILILAESLFQVEEIEGISFNTSLTSNLAPYKVCNIISPSYGGRTAAAEFESLTGLSNLFISGDAIPYTTYFKKTGNPTGSIAREFHDNGYMTYAVHANNADYYNRDISYENMGFDDFISKEDFHLTSEDFLRDNLANDSVFVDMILKVVENSQEPVFLFGASLEGHSPYGEKYSSTHIQAESHCYSSEAVKELGNYGQTVYNFDIQMGRLIDYFETEKKPVLIYIYGDHLPPLLVNSEDGYLSDDYLKYTTPLYAYSNYCDTSIAETYLSLSQVAPEILHKSGIQYRAYYDYIYKLRQEYPITHKNITKSVDSESLKTYQRIQWDLLQGNRYLLD